MSVFKAIENRTENWKTARYFSPLLGKGNARLAELGYRLGESRHTPPDEIQIELFWKGMRDFLYKGRGKRTREDNEADAIDLAKRFECIFPDLREKIQGFGRSQDPSRKTQVESLEGNTENQQSFRKLNELNYNTSAQDSSWKSKLFDNLRNTEVDIVLESPNYLFIGEAKHESGFDADGTRFLVHQLVREFVLARVLLHRLGSQKEVIPFVVGNNVERLRSQPQIIFMIRQTWMKEENVLSWDDIS